MNPFPVYEPPPGLRTSIDDLRDFISWKYAANLHSYHDLHEFSIERANDFWMALWQFLDIQASTQPSKAINETLRIDQFPQFFEDSMLNYAENMLRPRGSGVAVKCMNELSLNTPKSVTWDELREMVRQTTDAMKSSGLHAEDVVIMIGGNSIESLVLLLATAAIGAVFCSFATDLGEETLHDRLSQLTPKLVFAQPEYLYNGKFHDITEKCLNVFATITRAPGAQLISCHKNGSLQASKNGSNSAMIPWNDFLNRGTGRELNFQQVPFSHPLVVMFSSGTTGTPKGIVHSHGGLVVNGKKEHRLHNNFGPEDVYFHFTNIGWTLWNISLGALFCGSTLILYDGSPFYPNPSAFLRSIFATGVTAFGAGPRYFEELRSAAIEPRSFTQNLDLIVSTGAILTTSLSSWIAKAFGPVCQISMSGGTELCGSFVHGTRNLPTWPGRITVKALGLDVDIFSSDGQQVASGEMGELVCKRPFPNMPAFFLHDPGKKRYFDTYFSKIPHVWTHGDLIKVEPKTGGFFILGRSDGVLNPSGVRFGSSEIYSVLARHFCTSVLDSICVGQLRPDKDLHERVFLFVKLSPSHKKLFVSQLEPAIRQKIAKDLSRRHVPHFILEQDSIPYNTNGKKMETQVKAVLNQGKSALLAMKISDDERAALESFVKFFETEISTTEQGSSGRQKGQSRL